MSLKTRIRGVATQIAHRGRRLVTRSEVVDPAWQGRAGWELDAGLWLLDGRPETSTGIPDEAKAFYLVRAVRAPGATVFVETGTFHGDMVARLRPHVAEAHTIELSVELHFARSSGLRRIPTCTSTTATPPSCCRSCSSNCKRPR
jgi:hypothetical protein